MKEEYGRIIVAADGSLDFTNTREFWETLKTAATTADDVVLDLRSVFFIDTAVLEYIARAGRAMQQRDKRLKVVVLDQSHPQRVLHLSHFQELVDIEIRPEGSQN
ncbi:MAG: STAS domain-containing protein [Armatimonadetes bacterium]|nr:STAS domain-containing protein [Armatimonadota bacterium]